MINNQVIEKLNNKNYDVPGYQMKAFGLETIHKCNARCSFCCFGHYKNQEVTNIFTGEKWKKENKLMDIELIKSIIDKHDIKSFILTGQTEPFLDNRISDILKLGKDKDDDFNLSIFSNANLMTDEVMDKLISDKCFKSINFSLNAFSDETRMDIMGISYEIGKEKIMRFLEKRREYGREVKIENPSPSNDDKQDLRVGISFIMAHGMYKNKLVSNIKEIESFKEYWNKILIDYSCNNQVGVFPSGNWAGSIPSEALYQKMEEPNPIGCGQWECQSPAIDVDGNIMLCCYNYSLSFGSCLDDEAIGRWINRKEIFNVNDSKVYASPYCDVCSYRYVPYSPEYYNLCKM